jgi:hypothetical protein
MPITSRVHYFRDENDDRTVVETTRLDTGRYKATVIEGIGEGALGYGHSRLAAIADLHHTIQKELAS